MYPILTSGVKTITDVCMDLSPTCKANPDYTLRIVCFSKFVLGTPFCLPGIGIKFFNVFESRVSNSLLILCLLEILLVTWCYGINRFFKMLNDMGMINCHNRSCRYSLGFLRNPQIFEKISNLIFKSSGRCRQIFCGLLGIPQLIEIL